MASALEKFVSLFFRKPSRPLEDDEYTLFEYFVTDKKTVSHRLPPDTLLLQGEDVQEGDNNVVNIAQTTVTHFVISEAPSLKHISTVNLPVTVLTHLLIVRCGLIDLPSSIDTLTSLQVLDITGNRLKELPESIGNLSDLRQLYIMSNSIRVLPMTIINLNALERFETIDNPIYWPPTKICDKGFDAIKEFITEALEFQTNRRNVFTGSKAYGTTLFHGTQSVPSLRSIVLEVLLAEGIDVTDDNQDFLPHILKKQLTYINDFGKPSVPLSKCSKCCMYFTNDSKFNDHICRVKT